MENPILALIPSGYKAQKVYSVLPNDGSGDFTFDRANGLATRFNKEELIEEVANDTPRLDYTNSSCPSLLLESESTNLQVYSQEFDNSAWLKIQSTITANNTTSPSGEFNADKLQRTATNSSFVLDSISKASVAKTYTTSIFVRQGKGNFLAIRAQGQYPSRVDLRFNFSTKQITQFLAVSNFTALSSSVKEFKNGWFRISMTYTTDAYTQVSNYFSTRSSDGNVDSSDINIEANCFLWGCQVEENSFETSYIPTTVTQTRFTDICKEGGNATLFDITEGSFFVDVLPFNRGLVSTISLSNNSTIERILIQFQSNGTKVRLFSSGGVSNYQTITFNQRNKILVTFKLNDYKLYINGAFIVRDISAFVPTGLDRVNFSNSTANSDFFQGEVHDTRVYDKVLTEAEAIKLTT